MHALTNRLGTLALSTALAFSLSVAAQARGGAPDGLGGRAPCHGLLALNSAGQANLLQGAPPCDFMIGGSTRTVRSKPPAPAGECGTYAGSGVDVSQCENDVATARAATAKYRDVNAAAADGFVKFTDCESSPAGAMGEHWARVDRMVDPVLDVAAPEILLYLPTPEGRVLLGAEYEQTATFGGLPSWGPTEPTGAVSARPAMFGGKPFDGPMAGHNPIQPWHYDLHVWLWKTNPAGLFAQYNPDARCS